MKKVVSHLSEVFNWDSKQPEQPITLVLGSFNPYNPNDETRTDFYYSRPPLRGGGNRFWSTIGKLKYNNPKYFKENPEKRFEELRESRFMFLDLIKSIEFSSEDEFTLNQYLIEKVFKDFGDKDIWKTNTKPNGIRIHLKRNYNQKIIEILSTTKSIKRVINTLGADNGTLEPKARDKEWNEFRNQLFEVCESRPNIELILESVSPAPQGGSAEILEEWISKHILETY